MLTRWAVLDADGRVKFTVTIDTVDPDTIDQIERAAFRNGVEIVRLRDEPDGD